MNFKVFICECCTLKNFHNSNFLSKQTSTFYWLAKECHIKWIYLIKHLLFWKVYEFLLHSQVCISVKENEQTVNCFYESFDCLKSWQSPRFTKFNISIFFIVLLFLNFVHISPQFWAIFENFINLWTQLIT